MTIISPVLLSAPDAAKYLGISTRKIYDLVEPKGPIPCYRLGKRLTRFSINDLNNYINSCRFDTYEIKSASASSSKPRLTDSGSELQSSFQRLGIKPKLKPSTGRNPTAFIPRQKASNVLSISSKRP